MAVKSFPARIVVMPPTTIRPARVDEYDEIARVWMNSWVSTGLEDASNFLLAKLRARIPLEIEKGWSLFVADDGGGLAAMLALHLPKLYPAAVRRPCLPGTGSGAQIARLHPRASAA
jgi:hypothetical protein